MSIIIDPLVDRVKIEFTLNPPEWKTTEFTLEDLAFLDKECNTVSEFDQTNKRKQMYDSIVSGEGHVVKFKNKFGQLIIILETPEQLEEMPLQLWGRILRMFYEKSKKPFKVHLLANSSLRLFPKKDKPIEPENINGGYTYRCNPETIIIYRAEDATRVLIHELQHSCCLDNTNFGIDQIEAETEAWAELIYTALLSEGNPEIFEELLEKQSAWIIQQNKQVRKHMQHPFDFPWRYTIGKEEVWRRWNILRITNYKVNLNNSLRLTCPASSYLKEKFDVVQSSTIL